MDAKGLLLVLVAAVAGAVTIPLDRPGIGWAIAGAAVLALLRNWIGLIAAVLLGVGAVRSAGWVFALCAVTALVLLAVTVVDGRTWRELGLALPRWVWGGWRGFRAVAATSDRHGAVRLARGIGVGLILVIVFGLLLGSAEQRFADLLRPLLSWPRLVTFAAVALLCLGALHLARVLVGLLCGLTLVIVGSALWRMQLYVEAFGFTRTRLLATAVIVWLGLILLLLLALWRRAVLPRLTLAAGALVLLGLAALNPDRIVAQTVIGRWEQDGHLDAPFVASLSLDALPALEKLPEPKRSCIAAVIVRRHLNRDDAWNEWNAARANASDIRLGEDNCAYYLSVGYRKEGNWTDPSQLRPSG